MAALPVVLMAASTAMAVAGAVKQGQAASQAANYNSQLATQNAGIAAAQGEAAAQAQSRDSQRRIGAETAAYGASGVQMSDGSPADVLADSARSAALDNLTVKYNYQLRGMGYQNQANLESSNSSNASAAGYLRAIGAGAGGAALTYKLNGGGTLIPSFGGNDGPGTVPTGMNYPGT
jgi:hypothetical protein